MVTLTHGRARQAGDDGLQVLELVAAVPKVAHWRLGALPCYLSRDIVDQIGSVWSAGDGHGQGGGVPVADVSGHRRDLQRRTVAEHVVGG